MKDYRAEIQYKDRTYILVFDLNVMERIQQEYGSLSEWGKLSDGSSGEPDAKAVIFGYMEMLNEGIDIQNEENGTNISFLTHRQVGRMITEIGLKHATEVMNDTVIKSAQSEEKNA